MSSSIILCIVRELLAPKNAALIFWYSFSKDKPFETIRKQGQGNQCRTPGVKFWVKTVAFWANTVFFFANTVVFWANTVEF